MKFQKFALIGINAFLLTSCALLRFPTKGSSSSKENSSSNSNTSSNTSSNSGSGSVISTGASSIASSSSGETKIKVAAHTLSDSNPPINVNSKGQTVSESTFESFRNASNSKFYGNYNYTYSYNSGGNPTTIKFTKNGYYMENLYGKEIYERKSESTFYTYLKDDDGYLREETTFDIQSEYVYWIQHEIYTHVFSYGNYAYNTTSGIYVYDYENFVSKVKFQGGYLTYIYYQLKTYGWTFEINASFQTTINIPESYYYQ